MNFMAYPMAKLLFPFVLGLMLAYLGGRVVSDWALYGSLVLVFLGLWVRYSWRYRGLLGIGLCVAFVLVGMRYAVLYEPASDAQHFMHVLEEDSSRLYLVELEAVPQAKNSWRLAVEVAGVQDARGDWRATRGGALLYIPLDSTEVETWTVGDYIAVRARLQAIRGAQNPEAFDFRRYAKLKGWTHQAYVTQWKKLRASSSWGRILAGYQIYLKQQIDTHIDSLLVRGILRALLLGDKTELSEETRAVYVQTGAMHVLAVSGLHVGLVAWLIGGLMRLLPRRRSIYWEVVFSLGGIWAFALLSGAAPSVLRASLMFSLWTIAAARRRFAVSLNTLAATAFILLWIAPFSLWDLGFQLSFSAVLGILWFQQPIYRWFYVPTRLGNWAWSLLSVSLAAQLGTLPFVLYYFNQFSWLFILSGWVVIPAATLILPLGILFLLLHKVPLVVTGLAWALTILVQVMHEATRYLSTLPYNLQRGIWLDTPSFILLLCAVPALAWAVAQRRKVAFLLPLGCLLGVLYFQWRHWDAQAQQHRFYVYHSRKGLLFSVQEGVHYRLWRQGVSEAATTFSTMRHYWKIGLAYKQDTLPNIGHFQLGVQDIFFLDQPSDSTFLKKYHEATAPIVILYGRKFKYKTTPKTLLAGKAPAQLILAASLSRYKRQAWADSCQAWGWTTHDIEASGSWQIALKDMYKAP